MLVSVWSAKGGAGSTVVSVGLAGRKPRRARHRGAGALLVDLGGDLPAILGLPEPTVGLVDWLAAGSDVGADALERLEVTTPIDGVGLLPLGSGASPTPRRERVDLLIEALVADRRTVVADCGLVGGEVGASGFVSPAVRAASAVSVLVTRPCYLALRRAARSDARPDAVVMIRETGRALDAADVERLVGAPVLAQLDIDPRIARIIDAGQLGTRTPRSLTTALRGVA